MLSERWQTLTEETGRVDRPDAPRATLLSGLATLRFAGADALTFLQGYLTCDVEKLTDAGPQPAALTNLQGRVVASGWCRAPDRETLDWLVHASVAELVADFMARYLAFSRTTLSRLADDHLEIGLIDEQTVSAIAVTDDGELKTLLDRHSVTSEAAWNAACVTGRFALIDSESSGRFLPQMLGLVDAGAVNFDKGCYLGQEVVARAQHRGEVKRRLTLLEGPGAGKPPGTPVQDSDGREQGVIIASAPSAESGPSRALAVLRTPADAEYVAGGAALTPVQS